LLRTKNQADVLGDGPLMGVGGVTAAAPVTAAVGTGTSLGEVEGGGGFGFGSTDGAVNPSPGGGERSNCNVFDLVADLQAGLGDGQTLVGIAQFVEHLHGQAETLGGLWRGQQARGHGMWGKVNMPP
jgi:hypothetical protein